MCPISLNSFLFGINIDFCPQFSSFESSSWFTCTWEIKNVDISSQEGRQADIFNLDIFREIPLQGSPRLPFANPAMKPTLSVSMFFPGLDTCFPPPPHPPLPDRPYKHSFCKKSLKLSTGFVLEVLEVTNQWLFAKKKQKLSEKGPKGEGTELDEKAGPQDACKHSGYTLVRPQK